MIEQVEVAAWLVRSNGALIIIIALLVLLVSLLKILEKVFNMVTKVAVNRIWKRAIQTHDTIQVSRLLHYIHKKEKKLNKQDFDLIIAYLEKREKDD